MYSIELSLTSFALKHGSDFLVLEGAAASLARVVELFVTEVGSGPFDSRVYVLGDVLPQDVDSFLHLGMSALVLLECILCLFTPKPEFFLGGVEIELSVDFTDALLGGFIAHDLVEAGDDGLGLELFVLESYQAVFELAQFWEGLCVKVFQVRVLRIVLEVLPNAKSLFIVSLEFDITFDAIHFLSRLRLMTFNFLFCLPCPLLQGLDFPQDTTESLLDALVLLLFFLDVVADAQFLSDVPLQFKFSLVADSH